MRLKHYILLVLLSAPLVAQQTGAATSIVQYPDETPTRFLDNTGGKSGTSLIYLCLASPIDNSGNHPSWYSYSLSVTGSGLTSIVVLTNVGTVTTSAAHGLMTGQTTVVSGSTTPALNGTYQVTVTGTTTFTITTAAVGNATYNNGPLTITGTGPLLTSPIWSIQQFTYDANGNLNGTQCPNGTCSVLTNICANRASLVYK